MQFFGLLIPIIIGYFADEMFTGVIVGSLFWLVAWSISKQRQEERLAESATAGDRMQKLEQEIELLKQRLLVLEHEAVRDEAKVGQGLEARAVADVQTASEPLHVRVEPEAEAAPVKQKIEEAFAPSFSIPIDPVPTKASASSEPVVEEVVEAVAPVAAEQEELPKEEVVVASMPSENEEAPSRQFVIHKDKVEGGEYKFSDNPIVAWFLRGNPLLKTGIVVLFLGLAFLLRYASERVHVPVELRYLTVAGAGLAAVVGGWKLQSRKREYGLVLQGFGVAVVFDGIGGVETASAAACVGRVRADGGDGCADGVAGGKAECADYGAGCFNRRYGRAFADFRRQRQLFGAVFLSCPTQCRCGRDCLV